MLSVQLTEKDMQTVNFERFHYPCPIVQKRCHTLYLKAKQYTHQEIADILDLHPNSITTYLKMYQKGGLEQLKRVNYGTNTSALEAHQSSLEEAFRQHPPHSTNEALHRIETLTGIRRSPTRVKAWMKRVGLKYRKVAHLPAKADPHKQAEWLRTTLEPAILQAQQGLCHLFFLDAAHFVLGVFLCSLWSFTRLFIKAPAGRQRLNVLGAVNAITQQVEFLTNTTDINAQVIADFLRQLAAKYHNLPIVIVLDNARYQPCHMIRALADQLGITLLFLPAYSPNLNIIERLWKFLKKKALYAQYYDGFVRFKDAILTTLQKVNDDPGCQKEIQSLLTFNFQTFENSQIYQA
jgi:transposase